MFSTRVCWVFALLISEFFPVGVWMCWCVAPAWVPRQVSAIFLCRLASLGVSLAHAGQAPQAVTLICRWLRLNSQAILVSAQ